MRIEISTVRTEPTVYAAAVCCIELETEVDGRQYTTELSLPNLLTVVNVASRWARVPQSFARQYHVLCMAPVRLYLVTSSHARHTPHVLGTVHTHA